MFDEDFSVFFDTDEHGTEITVNGVAVDGIVDRELVSIPNGRSMIEGYKTVFTCATSDVSAAVEDDPVIINSVAFKVAINLPDGTGESKLVLKK